MNPTNEQELRELAHIIMNADTPYDAMQFVKDHTNAEIAKVLDRLEYSNMNWKYRETNDEEYKTGLNNGLRYADEAIEAERAKLKEVK